MAFSSPTPKLKAYFLLCGSRVILLNVWHQCLGILVNFAHLSTRSSSAIIGRCVSSLFDESAAENVAFAKKSSLMFWYYFTFAALPPERRSFLIITDASSTPRVADAMTRHSSVTYDAQCLMYGWVSVKLFSRRLPRHENAPSFPFIKQRISRLSYNRIDDYTEASR